MTVYIMSHDSCDPFFGYVCIKGMHSKVFHESEFPIYRWFRDKIGYSSLFKDIPPIIPAYQYSDRIILMELFQDSDPIIGSFMRCMLNLIIEGFSGNY